MKTNVIDINDPAANIYGCLPCPKCGSKFRAAFMVNDIPTDPLRIECDVCGFKEMAEDSTDIAKKGTP